MKALLTAVAVAGLLSAAPAFAAADLAKAKNCMACHAVDKKLVGPSYKDVAEKYGSDEAAVEKVAGKIKSGGSGVWGPVPMPPNPGLSDEDAKKLAEWVLGKK